MAKKKSQAQIRRLQKRAAERGEEYVPPEEDSENDPPANDTQPEPNDEKFEIAKKLQQELKEIEESSDLNSKDRRSAKRKAEAIATEASGMPATELLAWYEKASKSSKSVDPELQKRAKIAQELEASLEQIEKNEELKSKDRRSAKRKAEAIATEASGMESADALLMWYQEYQKQQSSDKKSKKRSHDPYIAFVGQLSFDTTKEGLLKHIQENLKDENDGPRRKKIQAKDVQIRLLTDPKTNRSKGMAFLEVEDPELLYGLLKLHQTVLDGRRINVERSAGGKKQSEARKAKLAQYRKEQEDYFGTVVEHILQEYKDRGELRDDELDEGVVTLCKRHAGPVVQAAVAEYMEKGGRDMDNPSAYLTFLLTKFATEGIREEKASKMESTSQNRGKRKFGGSKDDKGDRKRTFPSGIDMPMSDKLGGGLTKIFPSARRGRGRGYM